VSLVSTAGNSPPTIAVTGIGEVELPPTPPPPPPLSIALSWDASTSGDVVGYYVYRGTRSGGPYARLMNIPIPTTTYTDSSVSIGTTYYYVVTAVDGHGVESAYSNQAKATLTNP
jgi:fibronectin type 3 domain-containing protein